MKFVFILLKVFIIVFTLWCVHNSESIKIMSVKDIFSNMYQKSLGTWRNPRSIWWMIVPVKLRDYSGQFSKYSSVSKWLHGYEWARDLDSLVVDTQRRPLQIRTDQFLSLIWIAGGVYDFLNFEEEWTKWPKVKILTKFPLIYTRSLLWKVYGIKFDLGNFSIKK